MCVVYFMTSWRWVPGYEGTYEVSDTGRVRSVERVDPAGCRRQGKELAQATGVAHKVVSLYKDRKKTQVRVHWLVLEAFVGPRPEGAMGLHWDDDPENNHLDNLRWGTRAENSRDSVRNGKHKIALRTRCPRGHLLGGKNNRKREEDIGRRCCKACDRAYGRLYGRGISKPYDDPSFQMIADEIYTELTGGVK